MQENPLITTVKGDPLTAGEVLTHLKVKGLYRNAIYEMVEKKVVKLRCRELDITPDETELASRRQRLQSLSGLADQQAVERYLVENWVSEDSWNEHLDSIILKDLLKERVISNEQIHDYFDKNRSQYFRVNLGRIVCADQTSATKIIQRVAKGERFASLAAKLSIEKNAAFTGGYLGEVSYGFLPRHIEAEVFAAEADSILGPYKEHIYYTIYKIHQVSEQGLSDSHAHLIREQLFADWLRREVTSIEA